ncbi:cell envelope integrity protein TolA [Chordicoccus furentiruminis]|uniref:cell envelope integrity protein TolA n=1 Tax=Chordicoccus furentiruminis TaxID=2709410 RepID=UPI0023A8A5F3|nr:cell envelope integrity protein TolA [Chordicoccus furentiruminis]
MKKRNQLVSCLLTGMLIGGTAVSTACAAPAVTVGADAAQDAAAEDQQADQTDKKNEPAAPAAQAPSSAEDNQPAAPSGGSGEGGSSSSGSAETGGSGMEGGNQSSSGSGNQGGTGSESGSQSGSPENPADPDSGKTDPGSGTTDPADPDSGKTDPGSGTTDPADPDSGKTDPGSGTTDSDDPDSGKTDPDSGKTDSDEEAEKKAEEEAKKKAEEEAKKKAEEEAKKKAEEEAKKKAEEEAKKKAEEEAKKKAEEEAKKKAEEEAKKKAEEEAKKKAEEEAKKKAEEEAKKKAEEEAKKKAEAQRRTASNPRSSGRAYYSGSYLASAVQRQLALNAGFRQIPKKYALAAGKAGTVINLYEGKGTGTRVVGTMTAGSLCFIIDDENEDWIFVESGDVRGFVRKGDITSGQDVNRIVKSAGEDRMKLAVLKVNALDNAAYRYSLYTTKPVVNLIGGLDTASADRQSIVSYAMQFLGNPYVWGGESLTNGTDCSGFTMQIYRHFGIELPRCSYEQAEVGVKIPVSEAEPGDLIFYARDGAVYHVLMSIGNGMAINASSSTTGIIISKVNTDKACWAVRILNDTRPETVTVSGGDTTQASSLVAEGRSAYEGDAAAQEKIIEAYAAASEKEWNAYGFCRSVLIAQAIQESGWNAFGGSAASVQASDNNVLGMNAELLNSRWISPWTGGSVSRLVPQYTGSGTSWGFESMRTYEDIESCMMDYAAFKIGLHPELRGVTDVNTVISVGLRGYATDPQYQDKIRAIIDQYDLTKYDTVSGLHEQGEVTVQQSGESTAETASASTTETASGSTAGTAEAASESTAGTAETASESAESTDAAASVSQPEESEPSEAGVSGEVLTAAETDQTDQTEEAGAQPESDDIPEEADPDSEETYTASGETTDARSDSGAAGYSREELEKIYAIVAAEDDTSYDGALAVISTAMNRADSNYGGYGTTALAQLSAPGQYATDYATRLGGNVPDFVRQAVNDCLVGGVRNTDCTGIANSDANGDATQIGANWYFHS